MAHKFLKKANLNKLIDALIQEGSIVVGPKKEAGQAAYAPLSKADELVSDYIVPRNHFKEFLFPQTETIARYRIHKEGIDLEGVDVQVPEVVIIGSRPCGAASVASLRSVFNWDFKDEFYNRREDKAVVISVACTQSDEACFCTTVDVKPDSPTGSDILLKETDKGDYQVHAVTEKGKKFVQRFETFFTPQPSALSLKPICNPEQIKGIDIKKVQAWLQDTTHYENPLWAELSRKCMGCGACTFACPTCHCFDIIDEGSAFEGERRKNWDACQFEFFTLHASGHNPRDIQPKRWRNRFMCKFNFYPNKFQSTGCVGCGRCIRVCPVRLDITEVLERISKQ